MTASLPFSRRCHLGSFAFTVLELLVAMAVMTLLLVLLLQITGHTMQASKAASQQLDSTQGARKALDVLSSDLAHAVMTDGATVLVRAVGSGPSLAFLTSGRGPSTTPARFLAVNYRMEGNSLTQAYNAVDWGITSFLAAAESASGITSSSSTSARSILAEGILQFSVQGILEDGSLVPVLSPPASGKAWGASGMVLYGGQSVPAGWTALVPSRPPLPLPLDTDTARVRALLVAIAAVDSQTYRLLSSDQKEKFSQPASADPVGFWEAALVQNDFPVAARSSIRFHSMVIPLP